MKKIAFLFAFSAFLLCVAAIAQTTTDYTRYVNPFIGTGGHGHTFPGAVMPFGMVQLSPDTREANWDGSSGYHYSDDTIYGFSHTHLSGTGIPDGCDILFTPMLNVPQLYSKDGQPVNAYTSKFSHDKEKAEPGYYSATLDNRISVELTATKRVGFHRYTFPLARQVHMLVNLSWRDKVLGSKSEPGLYLKIVSDTRIEGYRRSSSWAKDQRVYFVAEFSKPFYARVAVTDESSQLEYLEAARNNAFYGSDLKAALSFDSIGVTELLVKVAISSVSIEGARKNLAGELPGWDFDKVRADAKAAWNKELSKIEVSGGTPDQMASFYTALYHTMIHPSLFNDVDGNYRGLDGKIHNIADDIARQDRVSSPHVSKGSSPPASSRISPTAPNNSRVKPPAAVRGSDQYTVFSLWDTFRAAHPLYTIIDQKRTVDFINTFIRMYEQGGRLPSGSSGATRPTQ